LLSALRQSIALFTLAPLLLATGNFGGRAASSPGISAEMKWNPWSESIFQQAQREHKFVLLDLEAVWCHWCHVMDDVTYADPAVRRVLNDHYLLVKVDQDARPDLSNRYEDYGWPATVVFNASGGEIVKRQGYMPPREMLSMLNAIVADPSPGPSAVPEKAITFSHTTVMPPALLEKLHKDFDLQYDSDAAGWGFGHKYLDADSVEYAMLLALRGDASAATRVRATLAAEQKLVDPVWGGADQYSVDGNWNEPHFEKLTAVQADVIRIYSLAYAQWSDPASLNTAQSVHAYVTHFLTSPDGAFYVSQDADLDPGKDSQAYYALGDGARRRQGIPRVDRHLYARENGWMIAALCQLYASAGDRTALAQAERAADWVSAHRTLPGGGFRHGEHDAAGPYLSDTLAMGRAFLSLYVVTGDRRWLGRSQAALGFINVEFAAAPGPGFMTSRTATDAAYRPHPERDENEQLARYANLLYQYTGDPAAKRAAEWSMDYLATPAIALRPMAGSILLAEAEFSSDPVHVTIVSAKQDAAATGLFRTALASPSAYKRIEWWDRAEGHPLRTDVEYPQLSRPAAFLCRERSCSLPIFEAQKLESKILQALRHPQG
jgi:uncharacterized protein YyaL (SSP411 family)